ncbi:MAG: sigma-70 family RNA polymerase sigma factor, partial [Ferruginibacter sp.]
WKFHSAIYSNVLKLTRDSFIAEDIVQEVFISLWEKRCQIDPEQEIGGWLFVVSYNKSVSHLKLKLKESLVQAALQPTLEVTIDEDHDLVHAQVNLLAKAIEQLSPQKRRVFELCKLQHKTYEETAEELKLSKHTVKEYLSSAVNSIKEYINQHPEHAFIFLFAISFENFLP